ncbi:hypothetical protein MRBLMR1_004890 [Neorhizobium sp. LMR1-1-1.1]
MPIPVENPSANPAAFAAIRASLNLPSAEALQLPRYYCGFFRGRASDTQIERLWVGASLDGLSFSTIEANYAPPNPYTVRDPSFVRYGGYIYCAHTVGSFGSSTGFGIARSKDGINYEWVGLVSLAAVSGVNRVWAPEWFVDDAGGLHIIVSTSSDSGATFSFYEVRPSSGDPAGAWSVPSQLTGTPNTAIDATITKVSSTYHLFYKVQGGDGNSYIHHATATALLGPYTTLTTDNQLGFGKYVEAPTVIKLPSGSYRIYYDKYFNAVPLTAESSDLNTFAGIQGVGKTDGLSRHAGYLCLDATDNVGIGYAAAVMAAAARRSRIADLGLNCIVAPTKQGFTYGTNGPNAGNSRGVRVVPTRDMRIGQLGFILTTASASNDTIELAIYSGGGTKLATTGIVSGALNAGTGLKKVALTAPFTLRSGAAYYLFLSLASKAGSPSFKTVVADADAIKLVGNLDANAGFGISDIVYYGGTGGTALPAEITFEADTATTLGYLMAAFEG